jgi:hypothetical protein
MIFRNRQRYQRWLLVSIVGAGVLFAGLVGLHWLERKRTYLEQYTVYSAYLSQGLMGDAHDWGVSSQILVVIQQSTTTSNNLRWGWLQPLHSVETSLTRLKDTNRSTRLSFVIANLFRTNLGPNFQLPSRALFTLASEEDVRSYGEQSGIFDQWFPGNHGYITLSNVGFNRDLTEAAFYIDHFCGLCGGGRFVVMQKRDGRWQIKEEHYKWIS